MSGFGQNKKTLYWVIFFIATSFILISFSSCRKEMVRSEHEVFLKLGETVDLVIENIPDGKTLSDYTWDNSNGITINYPGNITGDEMGSGYVSASLDYKGKTYFEYFKITVETVVNELTISKTKAVLRTGGNLFITAVPDITMPSSEKIQWESSDESVVTVARSTNNNNTDDSMAVISANGKGTATVSAFYGDTRVSCDVTVFDINSANNMLSYVYALKENDNYIFDGTSFTEMEDFKTSLTGEELKKMTAKTPKGKYLVLWNSESYEIDDSYDLCYDYTSLLPLEYIPKSLSDVEYIIKAVEGEPIYAGTYEGGVKGYIRTADIIIENAVTGETVEILDTLQGKDIPNKIYASEDYPKENYYGNPVGMESLRNSLFKIIGEMWKKECGSIVFTKDEAVAKMVCGEKVSLSENIKSIQLISIGYTGELVIPDSVTDIGGESYLYNSIGKITVTKESPAYKYFSNLSAKNINVK